MAVLLPRAKSGPAFNRVAPKLPIVESSNQTIAVPAATLNLTALTPTVVATANNYIAVPAASLQINAKVPTVTATANNYISVPAASLQLSAYAPTVTATASNYISVPAGAIQLSAYAPTVTVNNNQTIAVPAATLNLSAYAPSVVVTAHNYISVPSATITLQAYAPTVSNGETQPTGGGNSTSMRRGKRHSRIKTYADLVQEYANLKVSKDNAEIKLNKLSEPVVLDDELDDRVAQALRSNYLSEIDHELKLINETINAVRTDMIAAMADEQESEELLLMLVMM